MRILPTASSYPNTTLKTGTPFQNANLDGRTGSDELLIEFARVLDQSGTIRLGTDWYWNLKGSKVRQISPPTSWDNWPAFPFAMDLDGDGRDEIVTWSQSLIVVGQTQGGNPTPALRYVGCYKDQIYVGNLREQDLSGYVFNTTAMTIAMCTSTCIMKGYNFAGTRSGRYCFCGNICGRYGVANNCTYACASDQRKICGGVDANSIYDLR